MQYGQALDHLIREIIISNPSLGPVHILKADVSDGFYRIGLQPTDSPNLGKVFPSKVEDEELVAIPITLYMGWKNLPPIFCTATETVADIANASLHCNTFVLPHRLDDIAEAIVREEPTTLHPEPAGLTRDQYISRTNANPTAYVDVFVNNFLGISQVPAHCRRKIRQTLF